jgi:NAD(P)H-hydrate repair Nnr-like enzyme with NAD(P)H-hydrate dehydratase domain
VVGPGLGRAADEEVRRLWREFAGPAVFDADGLRALDGTPSPFPRILTPHAGEAAALIGAMEGPLPAWRDLEADRLATTRRLAALGSVIYKGACPVVSGSPLAVLDGRVPALGTGGSGDVLAGLCGALLANARGAGSDRDHTDSVALAAAWLHLEAGRRLPVGASASEIARAVATVRAEAS